MSDDWEDMGLSVSRGKLVWDWKHGALRWAPYRFRRAVIDVWNPIGCFIWGHYIVGPYPEGDIAKHCADCSKEWP